MWHMVAMPLPDHGESSRADRHGGTGGRVLKG